MTCQDIASLPSCFSPFPEIQLEATDWYLATWRDLPALSRPDPAPFDLNLCLERLKKLRVSRRGAVRDWSSVRIPVHMTRAEAHFWLRAMTDSASRQQTSRLILRLSKMNFDGSLSADDARAMFCSQRWRPSGVFLQPLACFLSPVQILDLLLPPLARQNPASSQLAYAPAYLQAAVDRDWAEVFAQAVVPHLCGEERRALRDRLRPEIAPERWVNAWHAAPPLAFRLAARLGMHAELQEVVHGWREEELDPWFVRLEIILGLGDPKLVDLHARRLGCRVNAPWQLRAWLAHTGTSALDWIEQQIRSRPSGDVAEYLDVLTRVHSPKTAATLLNLKLAGIAPERIRLWLDEHVHEAVAGLMPLATGKGKVSDAVVDYLLRVEQRGHLELLEQHLGQAPEEVGLRVRRQVFSPGHNSRNIPVHDNLSAPPWLILESASEAALPGWLVLECLPPLVCEGRRLNRAQLTAMLLTIRASKPGTCPLTLKPLRRTIEVSQREAFAWALYELWLGDGAPSGDTWVMNALGVLGADETALKLAAVIRDWAAKGRFDRARHGIEALLTIGSRVALMELNALAHQSRTGRIREHARELVHRLLARWGWKQEQLDDLSVPDLGLDKQGTRTFSYGARQFVARIGARLRPVLRDETGRSRAELPASRKEDDPVQVEEARREWGLFRKQLRQSVRQQAARLERSLVNGRRWTFDGFQEAIVRHPLLGQMARTLLWGAFAPEGELVQAFRLSEEGSLADVSDRTFTVNSSLGVGLVHPVHLTDEDRGRWSSLFGDYEIVPPFPQLGRPVHRLTRDECSLDALKRFKGIRVSNLVLLSSLDTANWSTTWPGTHARSRYFSGPDVSASIHLAGWSERAIDTIQFHKGMIEPRGSSHNSYPLKLGAVDPVIISEVLADVTRLAARGSQPVTA